MNHEIRSSELNALRKCPARFWRQQGLQELPDNGAESGTLTHAGCAAHFLGTEPPKLDSAQEETVERCIEAYHRYADPFGTPDELLVEQEFSVDVHGWTLRGHPDLVAVFGEDALIPDWKTLYGHHGHPKTNRQFHSYGLLHASTNLDVRRYHIGRIQPNVSGGIVWHVVEREQLAWIWGEVCEIIAEIEMHESDPRPCPGDCCSFCRDILCPARQAEIVQASRFDLDPVRWAETPVSVRLEAYSIAQRAAKVAGMMKSLIEAELKSNPGLYNGELYMEPGNETPVLKDPAGFFAALSEATGISGADVSRCAKFRLGDDKATGEPGLDRIVRDKMQTTFDEAKKLVRGLMKAFGDVKVNAPSLKRKDNEE